MNKQIRNAIFFSIITIGVIIFFYIDGQRMRKEHILINGQIISCDNGGKGNNGPSINYIYEINGKKMYDYACNSSLKYGINKAFQGHFFPVVFSKSWLGINMPHMLITPTDFTYFGYGFPDSLNWVLAYTEKRY